MSGFLRRLVERHASEPATRPRAVSRFETAAPPFGATALEGQTAPSSPAERTGAAVSRRAGIRADGGLSAPTAPSPAEESRSLAAAAKVLPPREPAEAPPDERPGADSSLPSRDALLGPAARRVETLPIPPSAGPIVPRSAPVAARAVPPAMPRARAAAGGIRREPDVVQVRIARVEVRAVLPPAGRPAPKPRETSGPLSLDRYLARGRRP